MFRHFLPLVVSGCVAFAAGAQLDPPAGPIVKTGKTLVEVEPRIAINATNTPGDAGSIYVISQPGSYYLTGNIKATLFSTKDGIRVGADNVTIDLMGYSILGVATAGSGIVATEGAGSQNLTIRNGKIADWGKSGILLTFGQSTRSFNTIIENVQATDNAEYGIFVGTRSVVRSCIAESNGLTGILAASSVVEGCVSALNGSRGIDAETITNCIATENLSDGISSSGTVSRCTSSDNGGSGIKAISGVAISDCAVKSNDEIGIEALSDCVINDCAVSFSGFDNISVGSRCTVRSTESSKAGTLSSGANSVGAGIMVTGSDNRIEDNNCAESDWGIRVTGTGNFIARNTCSGNTTLNWSVVANNQCLVVLGLNAGVISGDSGGTSPGSTNPNANFTY